MQRFLILVGVAVVAAAMYVAASPASQQAKAPTAKQFNLLKKQVATLTKTVKVEASVIKDCIKIAVPIDQFGDSTNQTQGYRYSQGKASTTATTTDLTTTALDVTDPTTDTGALFITGGDTTCGTLVNGNGLKHALTQAGQTRTASHFTHFVAHR